MGFECDKCNKLFKSHYLYMKHVNKKIPCDNPKKCPKCGKIFKQMGNYKKHLARKKPCVENNKLKDMTNTCQFCFKKLSTKGNLKRHYKKCKIISKNKNINNNIINHITNNIDNSQNQQINININVNNSNDNDYKTYKFDKLKEFGDENYKYIPAEEVFKMCNFSGGSSDKLLYYIAKLLWCDPKHPENRNIIMLTKKNGVSVAVYKSNKRNDIPKWGYILPTSAYEQMLIRISDILKEKKEILNGNPLVSYGHLKMLKKIIEPKYKYIYCYFNKMRKVLKEANPLLLQKYPKFKKYIKQIELDSPNISDYDSDTF